MRAMPFCALPLVAALSWLSPVWASVDVGEPVSSGHHSADRLEGHVRALASDEYEGRGAGYAGERMAAGYIAAAFSAGGLQAPFADRGPAATGYLQPFALLALDAPEPWQVLESQNVVGVLPGSDLAHEIVVVGAHYDGQGRSGQARLGRNDAPPAAPSLAPDQIWNSAVDNAVSIAVLIETARSFATGGAPLRRTVVFVAFGAEESALDGSTYYANNPYGGRATTKAMVNLEKLVGDPEAEFLYVSYGTSEVFPLVTDVVTRRTGVSLTPFYPGVIANTDHYAFVLSRIPAITIGTGSENNVHLPTDDADGLDYTLLAQRADFVSAYLTELANSDNDMTFSGDLSGHYGASGGPATKDERALRGFEGDVAFKLASVVEATPADQSGLRPGDLIVSINGEALEAQAFYQGLEDLFPEEALCARSVLTVVRRDQRVELTFDPRCSE